MLRTKNQTLWSYQSSNTPTHIHTAHAISKFSQNFQNRIPMELEQNFYIPGISTTHWFIFHIFVRKKWLHKKVNGGPLPRIQPIYGNEWIMRIEKVMNEKKFIYNAVSRKWIILRSEQPLGHLKSKSIIVI